MVMDQGWCASGFFFRIREGNSSGIKHDGQRLVLSLDFLGPTLFDGNGVGRLYIDENTSADQRRELEAIFQGTKGGPMEIIGSLVKRWLSTKTANIEVQEEGGTLTAKVGSFGNVKSQQLKNEAGQPMTMQNVGFAVALQLDNKTLQLAPSGSKWFDPDLPHKFETKSGAVGTFTWAVS